VIGEKVPKPSLVVEVKKMYPSSGRFDGFVFPYRSFAVRVTWTPFPEVTDGLATVTTLWDGA